MSPAGGGCFGVISRFPLGAVSLMSSGFWFLNSYLISVIFQLLNSTTVPTCQVFHNLLISCNIFCWTAVRTLGRGGLVRQYLSHYLSHVVSGETEGVLSSGRASRQVPSASLGHYASLSFVVRGMGKERGRRSEVGGDERDEKKHRA